VTALEARDCQFTLADLTAAAVGAGQRRRSVRTAAGNLTHVGEALLGVRCADDHHSEMQQGGVEAGDSRLLAAVLGTGTGEDAADFADYKRELGTYQGVLEYKDAYTKAFLKLSPIFSAQVRRYDRGSITSPTRATRAR
jgi:hypothetical protein